MREGRGVLYVATGEAHVAAARASAGSVRRHNPELAIAIFTDVTAPGDEFGTVLPIPDPHARSKVDRLGESPFAETLYLDSDTRVLGPLDDLFRLLERFDLAAAHVVHWDKPSYRRAWREAVPMSFPQVNSGVLLYRDSPAVRETLARWRESYRAAGLRADQVTLRDTLWSTDLRFTILPPQFNTRSWRWSDRVMSSRPRPVILHMNRFHPTKRKGPGAALARLVRR